MIKIGDLLDLSSPRAASTCPDVERPRLAATVHHRPANYTPEDAAAGERKRRRERKMSGHVTRIKVEEEDEEKCPNVLMKNGVICTPYRVKREGGKEDRYGSVQSSRTMVKGGVNSAMRDEERPAERSVGFEEREETSQTKTGSSVLPSPPLDSLSFQNLNTKQLLKRLYLTRKLLALKKLTLKNKAMAVNLETLLPQAFSSQVAPPVVPSSNGTSEESQFSDPFSPTSMYGSDNFSFLAMAGMSDSLDLDPTLLKSDFSSIDVCSQGVGETLFQTSSSDPFSDWLATPMSLPITPDEPLVDNMASSMLPVSSYNSDPAYTAMQEFHHTPSPSDPLTPESLVSHLPLTPESLMSPESFCNSEEVDEVLSYLGNDSMAPIGSNDAFNVFPSPTSNQIYNDSCSSSIHSSYTSVASSPTSPFSSSCPATPLTISPVPSPQSPTSLMLHPITPNDTIRDLLARDHASISNDVTAATPFLGSTGYTPDDAPDMQCTNLQKRIRRMSDLLPSEETVLAAPPSKKSTKSGRRRRVSSSTKKERKREQNKTAALRYRQKKKVEKIDYDKQQSELEERNAALRSTVGSMEAEIAYLTTLWSEIHAKQQLCN